jgi:DNA-directed RNA polymerase subunit RPC12/RpoP
VGKVQTLFRCAECGAESDKLATGWRAYLAGELGQDEQAGEVLMVCPDCARGEFGPFGWESIE